MAWSLSFAGTPAACTTAVNAITSGSLGNFEAAQLARAKTYLLGEITAQNSNSFLNCQLQGGAELDGSWICCKVQPVFVVFTSQVAAIPA